ncbi:MAG: hypothetical protein MRY32_07400 [Rickettsiales bacterium]|nr:hypothetical protein [Rickettsiales bacterium]
MTNNPFNDVNSNGTFDWEDIAAALKAEELFGEKRVPAERAHGVIEAVGGRSLNNLVSKFILDNRGPLNARQQTAIAEAVETGLKFNMLQMLEGLAADPKFEEKFMAKIERDMKGRPADVIELVKADYKSLIEFSTTYQTKFPNGIDLQVGKEFMTEVAAHFGKVPAFTPREEKPKPKIEL